MRMRDVFDSLSPIDYRYWDAEVAKYLSENGFTRYKLRVERALATVLERRGVCSEDTLREIVAACGEVVTEEVYDEEGRIGHDIRALVNRIQTRLSDRAKPFVHLSATSFDIIESANAARYKHVVEIVVIPALIELEKVLITLADNEAETPQAGRTHGQHAVPTSFGFAIAEYVSRIGGSIEELKLRADKLPGKFSGAVGAYNASSLFFDDPEVFEAEVLAEMGLIPAEYSTQIVPPEAMTRLLCEVTITAGILANLADDMRHLQRTEIAEVGEPVEEDQVGSSTMPQKMNPINFENAKSLWKVVMPRIITVFLDQISEHQRDLTNSASARTYGEVVAYVFSMAKRLTRVMNKLTVNHENLQRNLNMTKGGTAAEPLQLILSALGHSHAHEKVRILARQARRESRPLEEVVMGDAELADYLEKMTPRQRSVISNPSLYIGIAPKKARAVAERWKQKLGL